MQLNVYNVNQMLSHVMLDAGTDICDQICTTPQFKKDQKLICTVSVNGIEIPAESFEATLKQLFKQIEDHYRKQYNADDFDKRVEEKAEQLLETHADNVIEVMDRLRSTLENADDLLVPYWKR